MSKIKFKLNQAGVRSLMQSKDMQNHLDKLATGIQERCGDGYARDKYVGKNRANAMVWAESATAKRENAKNNTILKAVRG